MIHVMNPYKMSVAMFRLAALSLEYQAQMMKTLTKLSVAPLAGATEEEQSAGQEAAVAKPAARRSRGAATASKPAARRPRKPSTPPAMPEPVRKQAMAEEGDAADNVPV